MVSKIDQILVKSADFKTAKSGKTNGDESSFSSVLSQEISQNGQVKAQGKETVKNQNSDSSKYLEKENSQELVSEENEVLEQSQFIEPLPMVLVHLDFAKETAQAKEQSVAPDVDLNVDNAEQKTLLQTQFTQVVVKPMAENEMDSQNDVFTLIGDTQSSKSTDLSSEQTQQTSQTSEILQDAITAKPSVEAKVENIAIDEPLENQEQIEKMPTSSLRQSEFAQELETKVEKSDNTIAQKDKIDFDDAKPKTQVKSQDEQSANNVHDVKIEPKQVDFSQEDKIDFDDAKPKTQVKSQDEQSANNVHDVKIEPKQVDFSQAVYKADTVTGTQGKEVVDQVVKHIESNFDSKTSEFSFNLYPKELGKVAVKMLVENGMLIVEFVASNAKTQSLLNANANQIRELLQTPMLQKQMQFVDGSQNAQPHDYLKDENHNNQNANQNFEQDEQNQNSKDSEQQFTEDFLSVMQMMKETQVLESW
ncbi:MAG: flagellar hook-length control protein FliK [Clostridiales bacterium]|nr:flagellar hook-length control protein FliK [Clostridiales bacterium]